MSISAAHQTTILDPAQVELVLGLQPYMQAVEIPAGERLFTQGEESDAFYIIDQGEVRLEVHSDEVDSDSVLDYAGMGAFVGEVDLLGAAPRFATAVAHTDLAAQRISLVGLRRLYKEDPEQGLKVLRALAKDTALKYRGAAERVADHLAGEAVDPEVDRMIRAAQEAQRAFAPWPEDRVDALLKDIAESVAARAEELAYATVAESHIGNPPDKVLKIHFGSTFVYQSIAGERGVGQIASDEERKVTEIASPVGVVFGLVPVTNPVPTFVNKALICLKARNALILSCHRSAQGVGNTTGEIIQAALARHDAPIDLVQWVKNRTSRKKTARFMRHPGVSLILATGGPGMVQAAYSSGKPAIGVGQGNAPAWIAADADVGEAARAVVASKSFDNGLICGSEQHLVVDRSVADEFVARLTEHGALVLDEDQSRQFIAGAFNADQHLHMYFVGQPAAQIAGALGIEAPDTTRLLVFRAPDNQPTGPAAGERLAPVVSLYEVSGDDQAIEVCRTLLAHEGAGHTAVVHTADTARAERFSREIDTGRILVNVPATHGFCGVVTGLHPSFTLGCGTFGGNSTTDNVTFRNLVNVKRLAYLRGSF